MFHVVGDVTHHGFGGPHGVPAVGGDERVGNGPVALTPPPGGLRVGRDSDGTGHVGRPAIAGLYHPMVVSRGEEQDRLGPGGLDDLTGARRDLGATPQNPHVEGLEVGEGRIWPTDQHDRLPRPHTIPVPQGGTSRSEKE